MTSAPASLAPTALSDDTIATLFRISKLAQSAGDTSHHELMAQVVEAGARRATSAAPTPSCTRS